MYLWMILNKKLSRAIHKTNNHFNFSSSAKIRCIYCFRLDYITEKEVFLLVSYGQKYYLGGNWLVYSKGEVIFSSSSLTFFPSRNISQLCASEPISPCVIRSKTCLFSTSFAKTSLHDSGRLSVCISVRQKATACGWARSRILKQMAINYRFIIVTLSFSFRRILEERNLYFSEVLCITNYYQQNVIQSIRMYLNGLIIV